MGDQVLKISCSYSGPLLGLMATGPPSLLVLPGAIGSRNGEGPGTGAGTAVCTLGRNDLHVLIDRDWGRLFQGSLFSPEWCP